MALSPLVFPYAAMYSQLLPPLGVLLTRGRATAARYWIAVLCLTFFVSDQYQRYLATSQGDNLWFYVYSEPIEDAILLGALSYWQTSRPTRIASRVAIPLIIGSYLALTFALGEQDTHKVYAGPFRSLLIMLWTGYTLLSNVSRDPERVWSRDWLWTTLGILLYFGMYAVTEPIVAEIAAGGLPIESMYTVYNVRSLGDVFAFILIWRGMRCPLPASSSGST